MWGREWPSKEGSSPFRGGLVWLGDWGGFKSVSSSVSTDRSTARLRRRGVGMGRRES